MRNPVYTAQFRRDTKKAEQRGYDMQKLKTVMLLLLNAEPLPENCRDHALKGEWKHYRDLHVAPDWLLIYKIAGDDCIFARTGTHSDIFSQ
ncbi:type II toxin-antitoxin system YafQ family toxin [Desulfovibrio sp. OttesenSCG-928-A18]|nr:type II toxin-antitoxin system YafQ family toxin [Desulfovibrio sp. OttesenSCG-928-A18]